MSGRNRSRSLGGYILVWLLGSLVAFATPAADKKGGELGLELGVLLPDPDLTGKPRQLDQLEPTLGIRGDYLFSPRWGWFTDAAAASLETNTGAGDATTYTVRTGVEMFHAPHWEDYQTFVAYGGGWMAVDQKTGADFDRWFVSVSGGQRFNLGPNQLIRWELRVDRTVTDDGLAGRALTTGYLLMGFTWGMPSRARDSDGDGVVDRKDDCPGTPRGAIVDSRGCPIDSDGDGVPDGIDRCPNTPTGWPVDSVGCPLDADRDGVPDGTDACPGTPAGAAVDERGCPDSDGDGVPDDRDACPDTPASARVDERGCPLDADRDGVYDGIDLCPDTPLGARVDARGCPLDTDGDGVYDGIDRCPDTPAGTRVDEFGCPAIKPLFEEERETLVLEGVYFELNRAKLTLNSMEILDGVAASLLAWPEVRVEIGGHTDSSGADAYNLRLSRERAETVRDYLISKGVAGVQLEARGYGEANPIADNRSKAGQAQNRRVELKRLN